MTVDFSNVLMKKYKFKQDGESLAVKRNIANKNICESNHVFVDARIMLDFKNKICGLSLQCDHNLITPSNFIDSIIKDIHVNFKSFNHFQEDDVGWLYSDELDYFVEAHVKEAVTNKTVKAFKTNYTNNNKSSITVDEVLVLAAITNLYEGRRNIRKIH